MRNIFGNVEQFALFYDSRIGQNVWYPKDFGIHPDYGIYLYELVTQLTVQPTLNYPGLNTFPGGTTYPGTVVKIGQQQLVSALPDTPRRRD